MEEGLQGNDLMESAGKQGMLVPQLIRLMSSVAPWLVGLLSICALAAMQSTGAAYMSTTGGMLTRDLLKHFVIPNANHDQQKFWGRVWVAIIVLAALIVASTSEEALVLLGGLAVAYGLQMWPALIAVCWWPWLTRQGITVGLVLGLITVTFNREHRGKTRRPMGKMAPHHSFSRMGNLHKPRNGHHHLSDDPGQWRNETPEHLSHLLTGKRLPAHSKAWAYSLCLGICFGMVSLWHRTRSSPRKFNFRRSE